MRKALVRLAMKARQKIEQFKTGDTAQVILVAAIWLAFILLMIAIPAQPKQKSNYWRTHDRFTHGAAAKFY